MEWKVWLEAGLLISMGVGGKGACEPIGSRRKPISAKNPSNSHQRHVPVSPFLKTLGRDSLKLGRHSS